MRIGPLRAVAHRSLAAVGLLTLAACSRELPARPDSPRRLALDAARAARNVVLVLNDTTRADRVGAYGGPARTPAFDRFARENLLFDQAWSAAPWTLPSVASLFTSLHPSAHGVVTPDLDPGSQASPPLAIEQVHALDASATTLAEALRDAGFRTAAFVSNPWMDRRLGLDQGFQTYEDSFARWDLPGTVVSEAALRWLGGLGSGERFFLYVHYLDSHRPYGALERAEVGAHAVEIASDSRLPPEAGSAEIAQLARFVDGEPIVLAGYRPSLKLLELVYDRGIEDFDRALALLLQGLEAHPAYGQTALVVTSDHGEALYERGWGNHGNSLYEEELHVPLAARLPGVSGPARYQGPVSLVDVMPTLCASLGVACPAGLAGVSLVGPAPAAPAGAPRYLLAEGAMWRPGLRALRNARLKLMAGPERPGGPSGRALFDLARDPGERRNLLAEARPSHAAQRASDRLAEALAASVSKPLLPRRMVPLDPEQRERLRALGYVQ